MNTESTTDSTGGLPNFLADEAAGTIPTFIQQFNISSSYGALGGLAAQANFHARPGVELDFNGDITLASNWNFGAGVVNVANATAAGLMTTNTATGLPAILAGDEATVLASFTHMIYRVGGTALGEQTANAFKDARRATGIPSPRLSAVNRRCAVGKA